LSARPRNSVLASARISPESKGVREVIDDLAEVALPVQRLMIDRDLVGLEDVPARQHSSRPAPHCGQATPRGGAAPRRDGRAWIVHVVLQSLGTRRQAEYAWRHIGMTAHPASPTARHLNSSA
jgi:hypothetical protein